MRYGRSVLGVVAVLVGVLMGTSSGLAEQPVTKPADARIELEANIALGYWASQGVTGCPGGVRASVVPRLLGDYAGYGADCSIWISGEYVNVWRWQGREGGRSECNVVVHEVGHALGLDHGEGIMVPENVSVIELPVCQQWARVLSKRRR